MARKLSTNCILLRLRDLRMIAFDVGEAYARDAFARLERDPRDAEGLFVLAVILGVSGRQPEAIQTLTILAEVAPYHPGLWRLKSRMYREVGDEKMAALCLDAAKRLSG